MDLELEHFVKFIIRTSKQSKLIKPQSLKPVLLNCWNSSKTELSALIFQMKDSSDWQAENRYFPSVLQVWKNEKPTQNVTYGEGFEHKTSERDRRAAATVLQLLIGSLNYGLSCRAEQKIMRSTFEIFRNRKIKRISTSMQKYCLITWEAIRSLVVSNYLKRFIRLTQLNVKKLPKKNKKIYPELRQEILGEHRKTT